MFKLPNEISSELVQLAKHYENFEENNRGANGYLFFATNRLTAEPIAIKFYAGEQGDQRHDEPRLLSTIKSRNVLPILDARNVSDEWGYFVTPRCNEGDLDDYIAVQPSAHSAIDVAIGICNGVSAIHAMRMLHRDLKPGNVVLLNGAPQIADFGSVRVISDKGGVVSASKHSILFRPPESFVTGEYNAQGDIYQVGLVAYLLLGGKLSYNGEDYLTLKQRKDYGQLKDNADQSIFIDNVIRCRATQGMLLDFGSLPAWVSGIAKRALRNMTHTNPDQRLKSIADVSAVLTQTRASLSNWGWHGETAVLSAEGRRIELRPTAEGEGLYQAFVSVKEAPFRKAQGVTAATLAKLISKF